VARGTKTARRSAVQARDAVMGCSSGQAPLAGATGLPDSWRIAAARALTAKFDRLLDRILDGLVPPASSAPGPG